MFTFLAVIAVILAMISWYIGTYNRLVRQKAMMAEAWSGIDVQLKRRHDLLPNLVETVKGYKDYEQKVLAEITRLRGASQGGGSIKERAAAENAVTSGLRGLLAVAEAYPELKANANFLALQTSLAGIEEQLQLARRYYNGTVRNYNITVESFPSMIVARLSGRKTADFFEIELATQRETPEVKF